MSQGRAVGRLLSYALGSLAVGTAIAWMAAVKGTNVGWILAGFVDVLLLIVAVFLLFAAWSYATGKRDATAIDASKRPSRFWERWPIWHR